MLNAGFFTSPAGIWRRGDSLEVKARFPVPVYLIEADSERILVDTGLHPGAAEDAASHYGSPTRSGCSSSSRRRASPTRSTCQRSRGS